MRITKPTYVKYDEETDKYIPVATEEEAEYNLIPIINWKKAAKLLMSLKRK